MLNYTVLPLYKLYKILSVEILYPDLAIYIPGSQYYLVT